MKKIVLLLLLISCIGFAYMQTMLTFDVNTYLGVIDQLYSTYDEINNMITMIEQNYQQIQFALERAKSFNWDEIDFDFNDGNLWTSLDIRDEITSATRQVNRQMDSIRRIENAFNNSNIVVGGQRFSIADMCGIGDRNLVDFVNAIEDSHSNSFDRAAEIWEEGLTDEQAAFLWSQYGLRPKNYYKIQSIKNKADELLTPILAAAEENAETSALKEEEAAKIDAIISIAGTGEATEGEIAQANLLMQKQLVEKMMEFEDSFNRAMAQEAWRNQYEKLEKEIMAEQEEERSKDMASSSENYRRKAASSQHSITASGFSPTEKYSEGSVFDAASDY